VIPLPGNPAPFAPGTYPTDGRRFGSNPVGHRADKYRGVPQSSRSPRILFPDCGPSLQYSYRGFPIPVCSSVSPPSGGTNAMAVSFGGFLACRIRCNSYGIFSTVQTSLLALESLGVFNAIIQVVSCPRRARRNVYGKCTHTDSKPIESGCRSQGSSMPAR
jgi:hypothetical protein